MAAEGLTTIRSAYGPEETMNRFEAEVRARGMTVFAHIDHAAGAAELGLSLRPTEVLVFGTAKAGTPLMEANQTIAIDLPLKALVFQDQDGVSWLAYNQPDWVARRHEVGAAFSKTIATMAAGLAQIAKVATES